MEGANKSFTIKVGDKSVVLNYVSYESVAGTPVKPIEDLLLEAVPEAISLMPISNTIEYPVFSVRLSETSPFDEIVFNFSATSAFGDVPKEAPAMQLFGASRFMLNLVNYGTGSNIGTTMFIPNGLTYDSERAAWGLRADTGERWFPEEESGLEEVTDKLGELLSSILDWVAFATARHILRNDNG